MNDDIHVVDSVRHENSPLPSRLGRATSLDGVDGRALFPIVVAWTAPIITFLLAAIGLVAAFIRWSRVALQRPTGADRQLVELALSEATLPTVGAEQ